MTGPNKVFQILALCTQRPGQGLVDARLSAAAADLFSPEFLDAAEHHGLDSLLFAHVRASGVTTAEAGALDRLRARHVQQSHACAVRQRVIADVLSATERADVRLLVLKGAAFAQLAYADPRLRPMRDVDLLVHKDDLRRAHEILVRHGFSVGGKAPSPHHHHLPGVSRTVDGATVTIELHGGMLPPTPYLTPLDYEDLASTSQRLDLGGVETRAPAREDLLWHAYAHGFVINTLCPGTLRLISLADVVHGAEAWVDLIDWDRLRRRYPRLVRALAVVSCVVPWSPKVAARLGECSRFAKWPVRPIPVSLAWSSALRADVLWPGEWWFRMRYGVTGLHRWIWYRSVGHPAAVVRSAARSVMTRMSMRLGANAPQHHLVV